MHRLTSERNPTAILFSVLCLLPITLLRAQTNVSSTAAPIIDQLVMVAGKVEVAPYETGAWSPARLNQLLHPGDHVRTRERSRANVYLVKGMTMEMGEFSELEVPPSPRLTFWKGLFKIFNREGGRNSGFRLPGVTAAIRGTDFLVRVTEDGLSELTVLDGEVLFSNALSAVTLTNNQRGTVINGGAPTKTAVIEADNNLIQWFLYYPGVLDTNELVLSDGEKQALGASLSAYQEGDLMQAMENYPWQTEPAADVGRAYRAALLLSVGKVDEAQTNLETLPSSLPTARALTKLIAAVKFQELPPASNYQPSTASEWLAESYYRQSRYQSNDALEAALEAAYASVSNAPNFGFAWERVAELEFSFGRTETALSALGRSLSLSRRNAQAVSLNGFLLAAQNRIGAAIAQFEQAIEIDSGLGNAWLGRGLCYIKRGRREEGLKDLLVAASLESQRSLLRSYLGKAFADAGDDRHAQRELELAKQLDPRDPTSWLYLALLKQQENRINEAISDLETSQELNDDRSLFRSRLLLDQDRAVRGANLASIYRDAGMFDYSAREASRAVTADYGNYSAHLFLANSYNELRDPSLVNLRYETATFSEYLVANLLSPVGGTGLSPYVSQQEYSRLFERDRLGLSSETDYSSRGSWQQQASQFGWFKDSAYAVDEFYKSANGQRPNNSLEQQAFSVQAKQQLTPQDSLYVQAIWSDYESGDVRQLYDPAQASPTLNVREKQEPNLFVGYHREWWPGVHTLFLGGRLEDDFNLTDKNISIPGVVRDADSNVIDSVEAICGRFGISPASACNMFDKLAFHSQFEAYSAELQQIAEISRHTVIVGGRFQDGDTETGTRETRAGGRFPPYNADFSDFISLQKNTTELTRLSCYGYDQWRVLDDLWLIGGLGYDHLRYPRNVNSAPVSSEEKTTDRVSPKAGLIWTPGPRTTLRGAYTRSLGGLFYDASVRLEPVQIAGFNQAYRSLIPESVAGTIPRSRFETFDLGLEQSFERGIYFVLGAEVLKSEAGTDVGAFDFDPNGIQPTLPSQIHEAFDYEEHSLLASVNQLVGRDWDVGIRYKVSDAELKTQFTDVPHSLMPATKNDAVLHSLELFEIYNHPSGFFAEGQALWVGQSNEGYSPSLPGDHFWQLNLFGGYHFPRRQAQLTLGVLNLTEQDYRINPLNLYSELPRHRTFTASFKFNF
jgi:Flp pilus assembly protein TadD